MNPKGFPKRLESKTSSLRITVPENLDLALEGLIRNVLREQPKIDDIYSFAANYFETLLRIRDRSDSKFTATQLCPFHNDEEARDMIVLAGTFARREPGRPQQKGEAPPPLKTKNLRSKNGAGKLVPGKGLKRSEETFKGAKSDVEKKQATPDLVKKLPLSARNQAEGEKVEVPTRERLEETGSNEGEFTTSDPIKEFVEKELLTDENWKEKSEGKGPDPSAKPGTSEEQNDGAEGSAQTSADEEIDSNAKEKPGGAEVSEVLINASAVDAEWKIDSSAGEMDEEKVKDVAKDAEDKNGKAPLPESEGGQQLKEMQHEGKKEDEAETGDIRTEQESPDKIESRVTPESGAEGVEAPLPPLPPLAYGTEKDEQGVQEVSPTVMDLTPDLEAGVRETEAEVTSPREKGSSVIGEIQETVEVKSQTDTRARAASDMKIGKDTPKTSPFSLKPVENDVHSEESDKNQKQKMNQEMATGNSAKRADEVLPAEDESIGPERDVDNAETSSSDHEEVVREKRENDLSVQELGHLQRNEASNKEKEHQDTKVDCQRKQEDKSTQERKELTSAAEVQENAAEPPDTKHENITMVTAEEPEDEGTQPSEKLDRDQTAVESEIPAPPAESERGDEDGEAAWGKKLPNEDLKAEDENLAEDRESPSGRRSSEKTSGAEEVHPGGKPRTEEATALEEDRTPPNEEIKSEKEVSGEVQSSAKRGEIPENIRPKEFNTEDVTPGGEPAVEEELCAVVDVNHIKKEGAVDGRSSEELEPVETRPEHPLVRQSAAESEEPFSPSIAPNEETDDKLTPTETEIAESKAESDEASQRPGKLDIGEEDTPQPRGVQEAEDKSEPEGFGPSSERRHVVIVQEPEVTTEKLEAEEAAPPGEIQIKTIQTHYYDALRVPETVTREYRVHGVAASAIGGLLSAAASTTPSPDNEKLSRGFADDNAGSPPPKDVSPPAEVVEAHPPPESGALGPASAPLTLDEVDPNAQIGDPQNPPTSDSASNLPELSFQKASEMFLSREKRFSSLEKEEIRFVTPGAENTTQSGREAEEVAAETSPPLIAENRPAQQLTEALHDDLRPSAEGMEETKEGVEQSSASPEGSSDPSGKTADNDLTATEKPISGTPSHGEDEKAGAKDKQEIAGVVEVNMERTVPCDAKADAEPSDANTPEKKVSESLREEVHAGSRGDGLRSTEQTATGEGSSVEADSPTLSATSEVMLEDSAKRDFASARTLSTARSLDLGQRNPLLRSRSLSTHRRGVVDFEVWNTIEKELEEAATKIQSKFRGYKARKKLRREVAVQISTEESSFRSTPVEADDEDERRRSTGEFHDGIVLSEHPR